MKSILSSPHMAATSRGDIGINLQSQIALDFSLS